MVNGSGAVVRPDSVGVAFDDERLIANAGLVLIATLVSRRVAEILVGSLAGGDLTADRSAGHHKHSDRRCN